MSTNFSRKFASQLIDIKYFRLEKSLANTAFQPLTDLGVSKAGRADLYGCRSHEEIVKHIVCRLNASEANYRDFYSLASFPDQPEGDWLDRRAAQTSRWIP